MKPTSLSVVMPYYNNQRTLVHSLSSLCSQRCELLEEIIVVDDGSKVSAREVIEGHSFSVPVRILHTDRQGQSAATNQGILASQGEMLVLTCADIIAAPNFLSAHVQAHAQAQTQVVVCGHISYAPWVPMSPFMHYLASPGPQFDFDCIKDPEHVPPGLLYAPNFSASRSCLIDAGLFDAQLIYGFQDIDLGFRLLEHGARLIYRAGALALHDHPNCPENFFQRQRRVGHMLPRFLHNHPVNTYIDRFRSSIHQTIPLLRSADQMVERIALLEQKILSTAGAFPVLKKTLFETYNAVMTLGFIQGCFEAGEPARQALSLDPHTWQEMIEQMPASFSPVAKAPAAAAACS